MPVKQNNDDASHSLPWLELLDDDIWPWHGPLEDQDSPGDLEPVPASVSDDPQRLGFIAEHDPDILSISSDSADSNVHVMQTGIEMHTAAGSIASETSAVIHGTGGDDSLMGTSGNDEIYGYRANDRLYGEAGDDKLDGGTGNDWLYGGAGDDTLWGDTGNDKLNGGAGHDELLGGAGNDKLWGGEGADWLWGSDGDDYLWGGEGTDRLKGGAGNDFLAGGWGIDVLTGGDGNDRMHGGEGNDWLKGGEGNDALTGREGNDTFVFDPDFHHDTILDFETAGDIIELNGLGISSFEKLQAYYFTQQESGLLIDFRDGNSITLKGVNKGDLTEDDFRFNTTNYASQSEPSLDFFSSDQGGFDLLL